MTGSSAAAARPVPAPRARDMSSSTSPSTSLGDSDDRLRPPSREDSRSRLSNSGGGSAVDLGRKKRKAAAPLPPSRIENVVDTVVQQQSTRAGSRNSESEEVQVQTLVVQAVPKPAVRSSSSNGGTRSKLRQLLGRKPPSFSSSTADLRSPDVQQQHQPEASLLNPRAAAHQRQQSLLAVVAINSTLVNSTASLPGREVDLSPVRPPSALSNSSSAASTTASRTMHKKRRAPPPPVPPVIREEPASPMRHSITEESENQSESLELEETAAVPRASNKKQRADSPMETTPVNEVNGDTASLNILEIEADAARPEAEEEEESRRKKKKKKKEGDEEEEKKKKKKKKKSRERRKDEEEEPADTVMDISQIPNFRMTKAADVHHVGSSSKSGTAAAIVNENEDDNEEELLAEDDYGLFDMEAREAPGSPTSKKAKKKKKEKKSRERKSNDMNDAAKKDDRDKEQSSGIAHDMKNDFDVHNEEEGGKSSRPEEESDMQVEEEEIDNEEEEKAKNAEDKTKEEEEEEDGDTFEVQENRVKKGPVFRAPTIEIDPRARASRRASQGGDLLLGSQAAQSETLRHQLRLLAGRSDDDLPEPSPRRREVQTIELDIGSDDDLLPSIHSSRSNSVVGDGDNSMELPPPPSPDSAEKAAAPSTTTTKHRLIRQASPIDQDLSQALEESFDMMSMDLRQSNGSPQPSVVDATNEFVHHSRDVSYDDDEDARSSLSSSRPSETNNNMLEEQSSWRPEPADAAALIQSPSPDSGIHDFAENLCPSPLSEDSQEVIIIITEKKDEKKVEEEKETVKIERSLPRGKGDVNASNGKPVIVVVDAKKEEETEAETRVEKAQPLRQHTLDRVLFTMSSYQDRRDRDAVRGIKDQPDTGAMTRSETVPHINTLLSAHLETRLLHQRQQEHQQQQQQRQPQEQRLEPKVQEQQQKPQLSQQKLPSGKQQQQEQLSQAQQLEEAVVRLRPISQADKRPASSQSERPGPPPPPLYPRPRSYAGAELEFSLPPQQKSSIHPSTTTSVRSRIIEEFEARTRRQATAAAGEVGEEGAVTQVEERAQSGSGRQPERNWRTGALTPGGGEASSTQSLDRMVGRERGHQFSGVDRDQPQRVAKHNNSFGSSGGASLTSLMREQQRRAEENLYDCPRSLLAGGGGQQPHSLNIGDDRRSGYEDTSGTRQSLAEPRKINRYSGPPSVSLGVWGEQRQPSASKQDVHRLSLLGGGSLDPPTTEYQLYAQPRHRLPPKERIADDEENLRPPPLSRKVSSADPLLPAAHWLRPELKPKPIEIRYRNGSAKEAMEDPRHAVLAASRKNAGGEHSLRVRGEAVEATRHPRGAGDGAASDDCDVFKESLVRKLSRELAIVDSSGARSGGVGNYHQGVVRLRSREEGEGGSSSNDNSIRSSLVEKRRSQIEGSSGGGGRNQWNYADSFHNFRKDRVKAAPTVAAAAEPAKDVVEIPRDTGPNRFYFGMNGIGDGDSNATAANGKTAVGKVRDNETLSQPFRKPRELQDKEVSVLRPPLATASFLRPTPPPAESNNNNNNNTTNGKAPVSSATENGTVPCKEPRAVRPVSLPPKEVPQAELNRAFTDELLKAKLRLRSSGGGIAAINGISNSQDEQDAGGDHNEGVPPPPPPPVMPPPHKTPAGVSGGPRYQELPPPALNPREELLLAIRNVGGARGLRKTRD